MKFSLIVVLALTAFSFVHAKEGNSVAVRSKKEIRSIGANQYTDILRDASLSVNRMDHLRALKLFEYVRMKSKALFLSSESIFSYYNTIYNFYGAKQLLEICKEDNEFLSSQKQKDFIYLQCARSLVAGREYESANRLLKSIKQADYRVKIILASTYLALNSPQKCIDSLHSKKKESARAWSDLVLLTQARCYSMMGNYDLADQKYKQITSHSEYYIDSLFELSWVQFKQRNVGDAKSTIDVLIASYDEGNSEIGSLSRADYYSLRFLRSYLGLVQFGASDVKAESEGLQRDLNAILLPKKSEKEWASIVKKLRSSFKKKEANLYDNDLVSLENSLLDWGLRKEALAIRKTYEFYVSLLFEESRLKIYRSKSYANKLKELYLVWEERLISELVVSEESLTAVQKAFDLRLNLAMRKSDLLSLTNGIRSMDEAKQLFRIRESYLDGWLGDTR